VAGDVLSDSYTTASFANASVGNNKPVTVNGIAISGTDAGNYTLASTTATTTANITPAALVVVTVTGVTASNKVYDGTTKATIHASAAVLHGLQPGDVGKVTLNSSAASGTFSSKNVGTGITVQVAGLTLAGADAGNYTLTQPTTTANITKAQAAIKITSPASSYKHGQVVNVNVQVYSPSGVGTPTGTVYLVDGDGNHVLGQATVSGSIVSFHVSTLGLGAHALRAVYMGDGTFNSLVSAALMVTVKA